MDEIRVSVDDVKRRVERGDDIVFIDARSVASWSSATEQIPGAIRVPPDDVAAHVDSVPKNRTLVTYCT